MANLIVNCPLIDNRQDGRRRQTNYSNNSSASPSFFQFLMPFRHYTLRGGGSSISHNCHLLAFILAIVAANNYVSAAENGENNVHQIFLTSSNSSASATSGNSGNFRLFDNRKHQDFKLEPKTTSTPEPTTPLSTTPGVIRLHTPPPIVFDFRKETPKINEEILSTTAKNDEAESNDDDVGDVPPPLAANSVFYDQPFPHFVDLPPPNKKSSARSGLDMLALSSLMSSSLVDTGSQPRAAAIAGSLKQPKHDRQFVLPKKHVRTTTTTTTPAAATADEASNLALLLSSNNIMRSLPIGSGTSSAALAAALKKLFTSPSKSSLEATNQSPEILAMMLAAGNKLTSPDQGTAPGGGAGLSNNNEPARRFACGSRIVDARLAQSGRYACCGEDLFDLTESVCLNGVISTKHTIPPPPPRAVTRMTTRRQPPRPSTTTTPATTTTPEPPPSEQGFVSYGGREDSEDAPLTKLQCGANLFEIAPNDEAGPFYSCCGDRFYDTRKFACIPATTAATATTPRPTTRITTKVPLPEPLFSHGGQMNIPMMMQSNFHQSVNPQDKLLLLELMLQQAAMMATTTTFTTTTTPVPTTPVPYRSPTVSVICGDSTRYEIEKDEVHRFACCGEKLYDTTKFACENQRPSRPPPPPASQLASQLASLLLQQQRTVPPTTTTTTSTTTTTTAPLEETTTSPPLVPVQVQSIDYYSGGYGGGSPPVLSNGPIIGLGVNPAMLPYEAKEPVTVKPIMSGNVGSLYETPANWRPPNGAMWQPNALPNRFLLQPTAGAGGAVVGEEEGAAKSKPSETPFASRVVSESEPSTGNKPVELPQAAPVAAEPLSSAVEMSPSSESRVHAHHFVPPQRNTEPAGNTGGKWLPIGPGNGLFIPPPISPFAGLAASSNLLQPQQPPSNMQTPSPPSSQQLLPNQGGPIAVSCEGMMYELEPDTKTEELDAMRCCGRQLYDRRNFACHSAANSSLSSSSAPPPPASIYDELKQQIAAYQQQQQQLLSNPPIPTAGVPMTMPNEPGFGTPLSFPSSQLKAGFPQQQSQQASQLGTMPSTFGAPLNNPIHPPYNSNNAGFRRMSRAQETASPKSRNTMQKPFDGIMVQKDENDQQNDGSKQNLNENDEMTAAIDSDGQESQVNLPGLIDAAMSSFVNKNEEPVATATTAPAQPLIVACQNKVWNVDSDFPMQFLRCCQHQLFDARFSHCFNDTTVQPGPTRFVKETWHTLLRQLNKAGVERPEDYVEQPPAAKQPPPPPTTTSKQSPSLQQTAAPSRTMYNPYSNMQSQGQNLVDTSKQQLYPSRGQSAGAAVPFNGIYSQQVAIPTVDQATAPVGIGIDYETHLLPGDLNQTPSPHELLQWQQQQLQQQLAANQNRSQEGLMQQRRVSSPLAATTLNAASNFQQGRGEKTALLIPKPTLDAVRTLLNVDSRTSSAAEQTKQHSMFSRLHQPSAQQSQSKVIHCPEDARNPPVVIRSPEGSFSSIACCGSRTYDPMSEVCCGDVVTRPPPSYDQSNMQQPPRGICCTAQSSFVSATINNVSFHHQHHNHNHPSPYSSTMAAVYHPLDNVPPMLLWQYKCCGTGKYNILTEVCTKSGVSPRQQQQYSGGDPASMMSQQQMNYPVTDHGHQQQLNQVILQHQQNGAASPSASRFSL